MERKIGKSVVATGIAATTLISGALGNHVSAEELTKQSSRTEQNDLDVAKIQTDLAKAQVDAQQNVVDKAKAELEKAQETDKKTQEQLKQAEAVNKEASSEAVADAKAEVSQAKSDVAAKEASVNNSQSLELPSEQAVREQENIVVGQQTLVDVAERAYNEAKAPLAREEQQLAQAQAEEAQANQELATKQANLLAVQNSIASNPTDTAKVEQAIQNNQNQLTNIQATIEKKEAELASTPQTETVVQVASNYSDLLRNLQNQGATQEIKDAATNALSLYQRAQSEDGLAVGNDVTSSATLENNLKAIELVRAINNYRSQAGLPELYVDPFANVASQIQAAFFERNGNHMYKYIKNENVAISYTPQGSVDFWHNEKALYQELAAKYKLPTDETQLDANEIYMKIGAVEFARVGHYLQMMDKKATAISTSYNTRPNQFSSINGTATVGFHQVRNLNERLQNGTLMSLASYENLLKNSSHARTIDNEKAVTLKNEIAALKVEKTNLEVNAGILASQLSDLQQLSKDQTQLLANAQYQVLSAQDRVSVAAKNTADKQAALVTVVNQFESVLAPRRQALEVERGKLASETAKLAQLRAALDMTRANTIEAQNQLTDSKVYLKLVQAKVARLEQAPQKLTEARKAVATAKANLSEKKTKYEEEASLLELYQSVYTKLEAKQSKLEGNTQDKKKNDNKQNGEKPVDAKNIYQANALSPEKSSSTKTVKATPKNDNTTEKFTIFAMVAGLLGLIGVSLKGRKKSK